MEIEKRWEFATRATGAGQPPDPAKSSVVVPIYQTSIFKKVKGRFTMARKVLSEPSSLVLASASGGVESVISHPGTMTHASIPPKQRQQIGITEGLLHISVGLGDAADLLQDLDDALGIG